MYGGAWSALVVSQLRLLLVAAEKGLSFEVIATKNTIAVASTVKTLCYCCWYGVDIFDGAHFLSNKVYQIQAVMKERTDLAQSSSTYWAVSQRLANPWTCYKQTSLTQQVIQTSDKLPGQHFGILGGGNIGLDCWSLTNLEARLRF